MALNPQAQIQYLQTFFLFVILVLFLPGFPGLVFVSRILLLATRPTPSFRITPCTVRTAGDTEGQKDRFSHAYNHTHARTNTGIYTVHHNTYTKANPHTHVHTHTHKHSQTHTNTHIEEIIIATTCVEEFDNVTIFLTRSVFSFSPSTSSPLSLSPSSY